MKRIILILFILITTATGAYPASFLDNFIKNHITNHTAEEDIVEEDSLEENAPAKEDTVTEKLLTKDAVVESTKKDDTLAKDAVKESAKKDDTLAKDSVKESTKKDDALAKEALPDIVSQVNALQNDEQKVKKWAKYSSTENYVIINKKDCSATVYDKDGNEIKSFEIGIGTEIGDDFNDTRGLYGKVKNTTPAGEYTLIKNIINQSAYGDFTLSLGEKANQKQASKKVVAMHKVPSFRAKDRIKKFEDGNLANNRMSHGCINFLEKDFKEFTKHIHGGFKVFVLPEEEDNQLILKKNNKGKLELTQTKY